MTESQAVKRARSPDEKLERRQAILAAADQHLEQVGFEAFSMATLAKSLGLAKGTLYLYFRTREEVFLSLSEHKLEQWVDALIDAMHPSMTDLAFCEALTKTANTDTTLLPLLLRLNVVIEHNVSIEALIEAKRSMRNQFVKLATLVANTLRLTPEQGVDVIGGLAPLLIGTAQADHGPCLQEEELPADIRDFMSMFDSQRTFIPNACRIVSGIRAGH